MTNHTEHQRRYDECFANNLKRIDFAQESEISLLKGIFIANGGSIIALLTFVGSTQADIERIALFWSFVWFGIGLFLALTASLCAVRSNNQSYLGSAIEMGFHRGDAPAATEEKIAEYEKLVNSGNKYHIFVQFFSSLSIAFFLVGAFVGLDAIT